MFGHRLGRKAVKTDSRTLKLAKYLTPSLPSPPPALDWTERFTAPWGEMMNQNLGCHDEKTEVLTDLGWKAWPDYRGESLGTMNLANGYLEFQKPESIYRTQYDGPMYYSDHDYLDFVLTPEHRIYNRPYFIPYPYQSNGAGYEAYRFSTISNLRPRVAIPASTTGFLGTILESLRIGDRLWKGDDLLSIIALVISDGWVGGTKSNEGSISFCSFVNSRRDMVASLAQRLEISEIFGRPGVWKFTDRALAKWFQANAVVFGEEFRSLNKRVPELVKVASQKQIELFLKFFGDKNHSEKACNQQFHSSSRAMIDDLQELELRTGRRSSIYERPSRNTELCPVHAEGTMELTLTEWKPTEHVSLRSRNKRLDHYKGEVFCATVPNSTLVTRRNGKILISGNCCTISALGHALQIWTRNAAGIETTVPDSAVLAAYEAWCGYDPSDPNTDQGGVELDVLNNFRKDSFAGHKLNAFTSVNHVNLKEVRTAIKLFGGVYIGVGLPLSAQDQAAWDVVSDPQQAAPGGWGGHAVFIVAYDPGSFTCITWGEKMKMTTAFWNAYVDESFALLSADWINSGGIAPSGLDLTTLTADLGMIR